MKLVTSLSLVLLAVMLSAPTIYANTLEQDLSECLKPLGEPFQQQAWYGNQDCLTAEYGASQKAQNICDTSSSEAVRTTLWEETITGVGIGRGCTVSAAFVCCGH